MADPHHIPDMDAFDRRTVALYRLGLLGQATLLCIAGMMVSAPGVRMAFNGEPVVLGPHTRNNVANLVLGQ